jgi:hypothetical protein
MNHDRSATYLSVVRRKGKLLRERRKRGILDFNCTIDVALLTTFAHYTAAIRAAFSAFAYASENSDREKHDLTMASYSALAQSIIPYFVNRVRGVQ